MQSNSCMKKHAAKIDLHMQGASLVSRSDFAHKEIGLRICNADTASEIGNYWQRKTKAQAKEKLFLSIKTWQRVSFRMHLLNKLQLDLV